MKNMKYIFVLWTTLIWALFAALFVLQSYFFSIAIGQSFDLWLRLSFEGSQALIWAILTPVVVSFAKRWNLHGASAPASLSVHFVLGFVIGYIHRAASFWFYIALYPPDTPLPSSVAWAKILGSTMNSVLIYWCIVAVAYVVHFVRAHQQERLQAAHLESLFQQSRLESLRRQIQPHFLFNTLHSISALMDDDVPGARRMITRLSDLLRKTLDQSERSKIPLGEEIRFIADYLAIESVRFQDRLQVRYEVAPEVEKALVPSLILQPLVENAIRHGVAHVASPSVIIIRALRNEENLNITILNTSVPVNELEKGIGLKNTESRLQLAYGERAALKILTIQDQFSVTIEIPYEDRA